MGNVKFGVGQIYSYKGVGENLEYIGATPTSL
jgi:hypothetical protein